MHDGQKERKGIIAISMMSRPRPSSMVGRNPAQSREAHGHVTTLRQIESRRQPTSCVSLRVVKGSWDALIHFVDRSLKREWSGCFM